MNKAELVEKVAKDSRLSKRAAARAVTSVFDNITKALKKKQPVTLVGFGTFLVRKRKPRTARNPKTGQSLQIKARRVPAFKAGKQLKKQVR